MIRSVTDLCLLIGSVSYCPDGICLRFLIIDRHFLGWDLSRFESRVSKFCSLIGCAGAGGGGGGSGGEVMSMVGGDRKNRAATNLRKFHYGLVSSAHTLFLFRCFRLVRLVYYPNRTNICGLKFCNSYKRVSEDFKLYRFPTQLCTCFSKKETPCE